MSDGGVAVGALAPESWDQWFEIPSFYSEISSDFYFSRCFFRQVFVLIGVIICTNVLKMHHHQKLHLTVSVFICRFCFM